jgi:hypothetical protein
MKADQTGDAMGRAIWRSSFSGDPGANFFYGKRRRGTKPEDLPYEEDAVRSFLFCFSSLAERPVRSGPQRSRARRFLARRKCTLDGEDRCERIGEGGKDLILEDTRSL